jgi:uncharacterized membrane protein
MTWHNLKTGAGCFNNNKSFNFVVSVYFSGCMVALMIYKTFSLTDQLKVKAVVTGCTQISSVMCTVLSGTSK